MTASLAGYLASAGAPLYSAAKHGMASNAPAAHRAEKVPRLMSAARHCGPDEGIEERLRNVGNRHKRGCTRHHSNANPDWCEGDWAIARTMGQKDAGGWSADKQRGGYRFSRGLPDEPGYQGEWTGHPGTGRQNG